MGLLLPLLPFLCTWNAVKNLPWHFAGLLLEIHSPDVLPATSCGIIPNSKIVTRWFSLGTLLHAWKEFPIFLSDSNPALALDLIWKMRKASLWTTRGLEPTKEDKDWYEILWVQCLSTCLQYPLKKNKFKDCVQRVNVISILWLQYYFEP